AIRGITNAYFLRAAVNATRKHKGVEELGPVEVMDALEEKLKAIGWDSSYLTRPVNDGFSGGEKKRNEILQLAVLDPKLAILDETDSGLDIDALKTVAQTVDKLRRPDNATVLVTHDYRIPHPASRSLRDRRIPHRRRPARRLGRRVVRAGAVVCRRPAGRCPRGEPRGGGGARSR